MRLWGLLEDPRNRKLYRSITDASPDLQASTTIPTEPPLSRGHTYALLAEFEYDIHAPLSVQTFQVNPKLVSSSIYFGLVVAGDW
ncbi:hypothetical protein NUW54_g3732 [Trametes sanguinea]|uniref:Uncharacterized protein n=1 Tax=Trametes sanguinea TaxID=158606 RepID=A0ACC1Q2Q5_9APHY|nr:hypothetical protein NUW54_g3732 [Trametes sanguinea]